MVVLHVDCERAHLEILSHGVHDPSFSPEVKFEHHLHRTGSRPLQALRAPRMQLYDCTHIHWQARIARPRFGTPCILHATVQVLKEE